MSASKLLVSRTNLLSVHCVVNLFWGYECYSKSLGYFTFRWFIGKFIRLCCCYNLAVRYWMEFCWISGENRLTDEWFYFKHHVWNFNNSRFGAHNQTLEKNLLRKCRKLRFYGGLSLCNATCNQFVEYWFPLTVYGRLVSTLGPNTAYAPRFYGVLFLSYV